MKCEAKSVSDTSKHPDVHLCGDAPPHVFVNHLGWPVHHGCKPFKVLECLINFAPTPSEHIKALRLVMNQCLSARRTEVTKLELLISKQDILYLDVSMGHRRVLRVHMKQAPADLPQDVNGLGLIETLGPKPHQ